MVAVFTQGLEKREPRCHIGGTSCHGTLIRRDRGALRAPAAGSTQDHRNSLRRKCAPTGRTPRPAVRRARRHRLAYELGAVESSQRKRRMELAQHRQEPMEAPIRLPARAMEWIGAVRTRDRPSIEEDKDRPATDTQLGSAGGGTVSSPAQGLGHGSGGHVRARVLRTAGRATDTAGESTFRDGASLRSNGVHDRPARRAPSVL